MYEVSLAFARPASIGARGGPLRQARFGVAGKKLWATLDALWAGPAADHLILEVIPHRATKALASVASVK
jgi:hypothetical protein